MIWRPIGVRAARLVAQAAVLAGLAIAAFGQQTVLIVCPAEGACELRKIASLNVDGKNRLRLLQATPGALAGPVAVRGSRLMKTAEISGALIRNSKTGVMLTAAWIRRPSQIVVPPNIGKAQSVDAAAIWRGVSIEYKESPNVKQRHNLPENTFMGLLNDADAPKAAVAMAKGLLNEEQFPRRADLIRGAAEFAKGSEEFRVWRAEISGDMNDSLSGYQKRLADPAQLAATLERGLRAATVLNRVSHPDPSETRTQEDLRAAYDSLQKKRAIATALGSAAFWDEFVAKLSELGLAKWSFPDLVKLEPQALREASRAHLEKARSLERQGMPARALDEASLAFHQLPCDAGAVEYLKRARQNFLEKNREPEAIPLEMAQRKELERLVNELDGLEKEKPDYVLQKIEKGPAEGRFFAPLQILKAKSLMKLDRLTAAREVVQHVARNVPLEPEQKKEWMKLDGALGAALEVDMNEARRRVEEFARLEKYEQVLELCARALTMDPENFYFLEQQVRASGFLNKTGFAKERIAWRMEFGNAACAEPSSLERMVALSKNFNQRQESRYAGGVKHWITGKEYPEGSVYYEPLSLGFLPRVTRVYEASNKGEETFFDWREFQLASVETKPAGKDGNRASFYAEPEYAPGSVRMTAIGLRGGSNNTRPLFPLIYLNSPDRNVKLLAEEKHEAVARGWAGNPFFHPFYWKKIFLFALTYDDQGRVIRAKPIVSDANQRLDRFSQTLNFEWEESSNRLLRIRGDKGYERILKYDGKNRLIEERITDPKGKGSIHYEYAGNKLLPRAAVCHSTFYDKGNKKIQFRAEE